MRRTRLRHMRCRSAQAQSIALRSSLFWLLALGASPVSTTFFLGSGTSGPTGSSCCSALMVVRCGMRTVSDEMRALAPETLDVLFGVVARSSACVPAVLAATNASASAASTAAAILARTATASTAATSSAKTLGDGVGGVVLVLTKT